MASLSPARNASLELAALAATGTSPSGLAQYKLSRLLELRGVIDSLRCEREEQDPLLSWVIQNEKAHIRPTA